MEHFRNKLVRGKAIGAQKNFAHDFNKMMASLENIKGDTATCVNCMLMLSTVTVMAAGGQMQLTCDLTGHTDGWLCGVIKGSTKEVSLDFRDPTTEMNEEQDEIVFPLYRVIKENGVWRVAIDARAMPRIGAYW